MPIVKGRSWIIIHVANGAFLTYETLQRRFKIDECHYTSDSAVVYTYVHVKDVITDMALRSFVESLRDEMNICLFDMVGYPSVSTHEDEARLTEHVGFKILFDHYKKEKEGFVSCTDGVPGITRGLFWKFDAPARIREILAQRRPIMLPSFDDMQRELEESKKKDAFIEVLQGQLAIYKQYYFAAVVLKYRTRDLDEKSRAMMLAPDDFGNPLFPG